VDLTVEGVLHEFDGLFEDVLALLAEGSDDVAQDLLSDLLGCLRIVGIASGSGVAHVDVDHSEHEHLLDGLEQQLQVVA